MGSATQDYIGGIAGLNVGGRTEGTIENCTTEKNCTVTGRNTVGGIVGYNLSGGRIQNNTSSANVSGAGRVGGIAGEKRRCDHAFEHTGRKAPCQRQRQRCRRRDRREYRNRHAQSGKRQRTGAMSLPRITG